MPVLERILFVEDDPDIQVVAKLALETVGGLNVELCSTGAQAVDRARVYKPHLILLDVMMPGMDGPTTLAALRADAETADIPAIFITAKVQAQELERYRALGALDILSKPFNPMTLADSIRSIWTRHFGAGE